MPHRFTSLFGDPIFYRRFARPAAFKRMDTVDPASD
jgi:hypothetical protein